MFRFLERLFRKQEQKEKPLKKVAGIIPLWLDGDPQYNSWNIETAIKDGYSLHYLVHEIINKRINAIASVEWVLKDKKGKIVDDTGGFLEIIKRPNERMTQRQLFDHIEGFLCIAGDMYFRIERAGKRIKLYPLHPQAMKIIPQKDGSYRYLYEYDGISRVFREEDILHFQNFNPKLGDFFGLSILKPLGRNIDTDNEAQDWNKASLQNGARPSGALTTEQVLTEDSYNRLRDEIDNKFSGSLNARKPLLLEGGLSWQQFSLSPVEMDFNKSVERLQKQIAIGLGCPPEYIGIEQAKYDNKRQALLQFWADTIIPELNKIKDVFNLKFEKELDGLVLDYSLINTIYMRELRQALSDEAKKYWEMGVPFNVINKTLNLGFPDIPGGDEPANINFGVKRTKARGLNIIDEEEKIEFFKKFDDERRNWEKKTAKIVAQRLKNELADMITFVEKNRLDIGEFLKSQKEEWVKVISAIWLAVGEDYANRFLNGLKSRGYIIKADGNSVFDEAVKEFVFSVASDRAEKILGTTESDIGKIIARAIEEGWAVREITKAIKQRYSDFENWRALRIARTETIGASNYGHRVGAIKSGVVEKKEWVASPDERTRSGHLLMNGERKKLHELYSNGLMYPGDPNGSAGEVINCRCVEVYITE